MNGPGNGHYVTPAMVEKQAAAMRVKAKEISMKSMREWLEERRDTIPGCSEISEGSYEFEAGHREGWLEAMDVVLAELHAREDAERERVNENINALDRHITEVLEEKEGGAE